MNNEEAINQMEKIKNNLENIRRELELSKQILESSINFSGECFENNSFNNLNSKINTEINNIDNKILPDLNSLAYFEDSNLSTNNYTNEENNRPVISNKPKQTLPNQRRRKRGLIVDF